jgi:hypothetical protein
MSNQSSQIKFKLVLITISTVIILIGSWHARGAQQLPARNVYSLTTKAGFREDPARDQSTRRDTRNIQALASGAFARYTESQGLPSSTIRCILEDQGGRLWISTQKGISRFDPRTEMFRNYDMSDGLQSNDFSTGCYQGPDGEMFLGGSNGFNAFFPESVRDNPYVPPVVVTSFKIFNKPVPIGAKSALDKAIALRRFLDPLLPGQCFLV